MTVEVADTKRAMQITGLCRTALMEKKNRKSPKFDPTMPQPFKLSQRKNGWFVSELEEWVMRRAAEFRGN